MVWRESWVSEGKGDANGNWKDKVGKERQDSPPAALFVFVAMLEVREEGSGRMSMWTLLYSTVERGSRGKTAKPRS